jgi:hypothetical protein
MTIRLAFLLAAAGVLAACSSPPPPPEAAITPQVVKDTVTPGMLPVAAGDCSEALRRAAEKPDLVVDQLPTLVTAKPAPLQHPPASALRKDGSAEVKIDVVIDTLGKADMKTFKVVSTSSQWLATNVKSVMPKWTFSPAQLAGCKVPRVYHFYASAPPRTKSGD